MENMNKKTALLVMDMQQGILAGFPDARPLIAKTSEAIAFARAQQIPVIFAVMGFRKDAPEISPNNKSLNARKAGLRQINMDDFMTVHPAIAPQDGDITVIKRRVSAFTGSDLEVILRSAGMEHLILTGLATSGVVLATLIEAADKDYRLTVLSDCCADPDDNVQQFLMTRIFNKRADVLGVAEWITR